jgi:hypothetical protein
MTRTINVRSYTRKKPINPNQASLHDQLIKYIDDMRRVFAELERDIQAVIEKDFST